ncbi:hypothetical protein BJV78DRAFT_1142419, partial [Lactifluus subvellereus]
WNSTYDMMAFVLNYRDAIDQLTGNRALKLRAYELNNEDWGIIEDLVAILKTYKNATTFFSQDGASIASVIPAMDTPDSHSNLHTKLYHPAI